MSKSSHRRPQARKDATLIEEVFGAIRSWAVLTVIAAAAYATHLVTDREHIRAPWSAWGVLVVVGVLSLAALAGRRDKRQREKLLVSSQAIEDLRAMTPDSFEQLVLSAYRARGWAGALSKRGADGGVDVILVRNRERVFVQCKRWRTQVVRPDAIRSLKGVMAGEGVRRGIFVSSGRFTPEARRVARSYDIEVVDGMAVLDLVRSARTGSPVLVDPERPVGEHR